MHSLSCSFWRALRISPTSSRLWELKRRGWFKAVWDITSPFPYPPSTCFLCSPSGGFCTFSGQLSVCLGAASQCWAAWPGKHREEQGWLLGPSVHQPCDSLSKSPALTAQGFSRQGCSITSPLSLAPSWRSKQQKKFLVWGN